MAALLSQNRQCKLGSYYPAGTAVKPPPRKRNRRGDYFRCSRGRQIGSLCSGIKRFFYTPKRRCAFEKSIPSKFKSPPAI
ncbi:MAG: hypothetical protein FWD66_10195 [Paludibacter sp.]|nr:hypothetical protein [Paludibacter sp.]